MTSQEEREPAASAPLERKKKERRAGYSTFLKYGSQLFVAKELSLNPEPCARRSDADYELNYYQLQ